MKMKLFSIAGVLSLALLLYGCVKRYDPDDILRHPDQIPRLCDIDKITTIGWLGDTSIGKFQYNKLGDPVSVTFNDVGTGRPNFYFWYDNKRRLSDYIGGYFSEGTLHGYEFWSRYCYQGDRVVRDTTWQFGDIINNIPQRSTIHTVNTYTYDKYDRIVKVTSRLFPFPNPSKDDRWEYRYNREGNLVSAKWYLGDGLDQEYVYDQYDNKAHYYRTNKVWSFLGRNYSLNNPFPAVSYNAYGLPKQFNVSQSESFSFLYQVHLNQSTIEYRCN